MLYKLLIFLFGSNHGIDRTALWTGVTAIGAFLAIAIAWFELGSTRKTARADFAKRFVDSFFTKETRELFTLLMNSALEFDVQKINDKNGEQIDYLPYFKIKTDISVQLKGIISIDPTKTGYSAFEIDDLLLGHFDDIAWYEHRGLIDRKTIREMFGYYIVASYRNRQIKKYLAHPDNEGKYKGFRALARQLRKSAKYDSKVCVILQWVAAKLGLCQSG